MIIVRSGVVTLAVLIRPFLARARLCGFFPAGHDVGEELFRPVYRDELDAIFRPGRPPADRHQPGSRPARAGLAGGFRRAHQAIDHGKTGSGRRTRPGAGRFTWRCIRRSRWMKASAVVSSRFNGRWVYHTLLAGRFAARKSSCARSPACCCWNTPTATPATFRRSSGLARSKAFRRNCSPKICRTSSFPPPDQAVNQIPVGIPEPAPSTAWTRWPARATCCKRIPS